MHTSRIVRLIAVVTYLLISLFGMVELCREMPATARTVLASAASSHVVSDAACDCACHMLGNLAILDHELRLPELIGLVEAKAIPPCSGIPGDAFRPPIVP